MSFSFSDNYPLKPLLPVTPLRRKGFVVTEA